MKFLFVWTLIEVGSYLPAPVLYLLADLAGTLAWLVSPRFRGVTRDHMRRVLPSNAGTGAIDSAARGCLRSTARYWADFARTSRRDPAVTFEEIESFSGVEHLFAAFDRGCGVILVTAHVGAPEFATGAAARMGLDILALTQRLEPPRLNALVQRTRRHHGGRFLEAGIGGARDALEQLRRGQVVALIADRDVLGTGIPTTFFGAPAPLPPGPIELALRSRAAVVPCFVLRAGPRSGLRPVLSAVSGPRSTVHFLPPLAVSRTHDRAADLRHGLDALARALEEGIRMAPDQWFTLDPIWPASPRTAGAGRGRRGSEPAP